MSDKKILSCFLISCLYPAFYYGFGLIGSTVWPNHLLRALAGMLMGIFVCVAMEISNRLYVNRFNRFSVKCLITAVEITCMLFCIFSSILNLYVFDKLIVLAFVVAIGIMTSGNSLTYKWTNKFISFLGKISMPMYIWHWMIATIIKRIDQMCFLSTSILLVLYYFGTIVFSILSYLFICRIQYSKTINVNSLG